MDQQLQNLLNELYAVDPALKAKEPELIQIIQVLLKSKPQIQFDESFKERLRQELQRRSTKSNVFSLLTENKMKKLSLVFGGVLCLLLVVGALFLQRGRVQTKLAQKNDQGKIIRLADNSFGNLAAVSTAPQTSAQPLASAPTNQNQTATSSSAPTSSAAPKASMGFAAPTGFGGGGPISGGSGTASSGTATKGMPIADMRIYQPTYYNYVYKGDLTIPSDKLEVLRKVKSPLNTDAINNVIKSTDFGMINLGGFNNLGLDNFSVSEDNGYVINVSPREGTVNIYQQYNPGATCSSIEVPCPMPMMQAQQPIQMPYVPTDQQMISIADQFIKDHDISLKNYGAAEVQNDWKIQYLNLAIKAPTMAPTWIPDTGSVIYPATINGINIYDEQGNKYGMVVNISFRDKKVTSVSEITAPNYESSLYETETDTAKIMAIVNKGGVNGYYPPEATKTVDVELGKPSIQLMRYWKYDYGSSTELYVPALVFPIVHPENYPDIYRKTVIVPIIKDILNAQQPPIRIMKPMMNSSSPGLAPKKK